MKIKEFIGKQALKVYNRCCNSVCDDPYSLPPESVRAAFTLPHVADRMVEFSTLEFDANTYYTNVIEGLGNHTVGPSTSIIANSRRLEDSNNDLVEDEYNAWVRDNSIGHSMRDIRREAAKTGVGIGIPYYDPMSINPVGLKFKVYGQDCLKDPVDAQPEDRIINGIEYDQDWEIRAFHLMDQDTDQFWRMETYATKEYRVEEVIWWGRNRRKGMFWSIPECYSAFQIYPYVRRYLQAVIEGEEFRASFPMAIELDPQVYSAYTQQMKSQTPNGSFEYEPRMVPTLAPGMTLAGMPHSVSARDRETTMQLFAATCALSVSMPRNLAIGDSSNSNMASAQVDIQPWANKVNIDRFDMEPMFRRAFKWWWDFAVQRVMNSRIRRTHPLMYPHMYVYPDLFEHPDPQKRASARATDLASGSATLNRLYSNRGMNFRREVEREAQALRIPVQDLIDIMLTSRSAAAIQIVQDEEEVNAQTTTTE